LTSVEQGLIFAVLAIGVSITFKILDFADMSAEGTFPMGAFIFAKFIIGGMSPVVSTVLAFFIGTLAGLITYVLQYQIENKSTFIRNIDNDTALFGEFKIEWKIKCWII